MKKALARVFTILALASFCFIVPGYPAPGEKDLHAGFDHDLLEVYFKRADAASTEASWQETAEAGIAAVVGRWESAALAAAGDANLVAGEKATLLQELEAEKAQRLTEYLMDRFFRSLTGAEIENVLQAVEEANKEYLYAKDEQGNIRRDASGDPVLYTRVNSDTGADVSADDEAWRTLVGDRISRVASDWEAGARSVWDNMMMTSPELLAAADGGRFEMKLATFRQGLTGEFERIRAQEERIFLDRRLSDQYSLRTKTDAEAAGTTVDRLIAQARTEGEAGIKRVRDGLERLDIQTSANGIDLDSSQWLKSFEREFNRGLDSWEGAEREFLRRRTEWEKETGIRFEAGQEEWARAYERLTDARQAWEAGLMQEKEKGLRLWKEKENKLSVSLKQASEMLAAATTERTAGVAGQISALLDMYLQADSVLATATSSIDFWRKDIANLIAAYNEENKIDPAAKDIDAARLAAAIAAGDTAAIEALASEIAAGYKSLQTASAERKKYFDETLSVLVNRFTDAHKENPNGSITVEAAIADDRFFETASDGGYSFRQLSAAKCQSYFDEIAKNYFSIDGQSVLSVISQMAGYSDPRAGAAHPELHTDFTFSCTIQGNNGESFSFTATAACWTQAWQTAASQYQDTEAAYYGEHTTDAPRFGKELAFWLSQKSAFQASRQAAIQSLADTYGLALGDTDAAERDAESQEWSELLLDDYQRELLIARGESAYWQKQVSIAEAVQVYARDTSSSRPTEAETQAAYERALGDFQAAEAAYQTTVDELKAVGQKVNGAGAAYEQAKAAWTTAREALEQKQALYQQKMGVMMNMGDEYYRNAIQTKYGELLTAYGLEKREGTRSYTDTYADYYAALTRYGEEEQASSSARELTRLVSGSSQDNRESLAQLKDRLTAYTALVSYDGTTGAAAIDEGRLDTAPPRLAELKSAVAQYNELLAAKVPDGNAIVLARLTIDGLAAGINTDAAEAYRRRIEAMSLLAAGAFGAWTAAAETGLDATGIRGQAESAQAEYLRAKAGLLSGALDKIVGGVYTLAGLAGKADLSAEERIAYACLTQFDQAALTTLAGSLSRVLAVFPSGGAPAGNLASYADAIQRLCAADENARGFLGNNGNIFGAHDYADLFAPALAVERDRKIDRAALLEQYAGLAPCLIDLESGQALDALAGYLAATGLGSRGADGFALADPETVWTTALGNQAPNRERVLSALARFQDGLAGMPEALPEWARQRVSEYLNTLANYFTLKLVMAEKPVDSSNLADVTAWHKTAKTSLDSELEKLKTEQATLEEKSAGLRRLEESLADRDAPSLAGLALLYQALSDQTLPAANTTGENARYALTASEAQAELIALAGNSLAGLAYGKPGADLAALLAAASTQWGMKTVLASDAGLAQKIIEQANAALNKARTLDQTLTSLDFTGITDKETRYALWQRFDPMASRAEAAATDVARIRAELAKAAPDPTALRRDLGLATLECVAGIQGEGAPYTRALYLGLADAGFSGNELATAWKLLCDAYDLADRDSAATLASILPKAGDQTESALFCYSGSTFGKAYVLKGLVFSGAAYSQYVDSSVRAEIEQFAQQFDLAKNYIPGLNQSPLDYAVARGATGASAVGATASLVELGIDDPFFIQFDGATGAGYLDFLSIHGEGMARNLSRLMLERAGLAEQSLAGRASDHSRLFAEVARERDLVTRWLAADETAVKKGDLEYTAKFGFNYRMALEAENLTAGDTTSHQSQKTEVLAADATSPGGLLYYDSQSDKSGYRNEALDQYNAILLEARVLASALSCARTTGAAREDYLQAASALECFFDTDPANDSIDANLIDNLNNIQSDTEALGRTTNAWYAASRRIALLKTETAGAAEALEAVNARKADYEEKIVNPLREELRGLNTAYQAAGVELDAKKNEFLAANTDYQTKQTLLKAKYDGLETMRLGLQTQEEILAYAKSIYLKSAGGDESLAVDPDAKLARARFEQSKADGALRTLQALYGPDEQRRSILAANPELKSAFDAYGASYRSYLRMKEAGQLIDQAVRIQTGNVERSRQDAYAALEDLGSAGNFNLLSREFKLAADEDGAYETWRKAYATDSTKQYDTAEFWLRCFNLPTESDNAGAWSARLALDDNFGGAGSLSSYSLASLFPDAQSEDDLATLKAFQDQADNYVGSEQFMKDFESWAFRLTHDASYETLMDNWENAYYYMMEETVTGGLLSKGGSINLRQPVYTTIQGEDGGPSEIITGYVDYLNPAIADNLTLICSLANPFSEGYHNEDHWYDVFGTYHEGTYPSGSKPDIAARIKAGQALFSGLKDNSDFSFFVFLTKTGVISNNAFEPRETATGMNWENPSFTHGYQYRDYKRLKADTIDKVRSKTQAYRDEQATLALLTNGNNRTDSAVLLNAIAAAARLTKPAGFDFTQTDADATVREYFSGAVDRYFTGAAAAYNRKPGADPETRMSDLAALLASEAAIDRSAKKTDLDNQLDALQGAQTGRFTAYRAALEAVHNARNQTELDAANALLAGAAQAALKDCSFQNKDALLAYYQLYQSIIAEYASGFPADADSPFASSAVTRGVTSDSAIFQDIREIMGLEQSTLVGLYRERLDGFAAVQTNEMDRKLAELGARESDWNDKMDAIIQRGRDEWNQARQKLEASFQEWGAAFKTEYDAKSEAWNADYLAFNRNKNAWIAGAEMKLAAKGQEGVAEAIGTSADEAVAISLSNLVPDMTSLAVKPDEVVAGLIGADLFGRISSYAGILNRGIASTGTDFDMSLAGGSLVNTQVFSQVEDFLADRREAVSEHTAAITARTAGQAVEQAIKDMEAQVATGNKNVDSNIDTMLANADFTRNGSTYSRNAITASALLTGNQFTTQSIGAYVSYTAPRFTNSVDLGPDATRDLNQEGINALVDKAVRNLRLQLSAIMGGEDDKKGEFQAWVGEQAELKTQGVDPGKDISENLTKQGSGEMGRIFRAFLGYELTKSKGESEYRAPFYNKPIWGEFLGIEGPSLRSLIDIGLSIITKPLAAIPIVGVFLNSIDDLMFMCADIATGTMSAQDAGLEFGKKTLTSLVTMGMGELGSFVGGIAKFGDNVAGVIGKTLLSGAQSLATNAATGAINALEFNSSGNLSWNADRFSESVIGKNAIAGYAGGMAQSFTSGMMGLYNSQSQSGIQIKNDSTGVNIKDIRRFNGVIGSAVGSLVEYGISGQTTVSLLNFRDIAEAADLTGWRDGNGQYYSVGLMELRLGGKKASLGIGMGGYDLSVGNILAGVRGMGDAGKVFNYRIGGAEKNADLEIVAAGTQIASSQFQANAKKLWEGVLKTSYEDMGMNNYGYFDQRNPNTIAISREFLSGGKENVAKLASIFDHEGTHYGGDRVEANAYRAGLQTYMSMSQLLGVGDRDFAMGMVNELGDARNQIANTGERDNWMVRRDGTLVRDGRSALYDENGKYLAGYETIDKNTKDSDRASLQAIGLLKILGMDEKSQDSIAWAKKQTTVELDRNQLHFLDANDHYNVLKNRGMTNLSFQDWTLDNARNNGLIETNKLVAYIEGVDPDTAQRVNTMFKGLFGSAKNADQFKDFLHIGMQMVKDYYSNISQHDMLLFTNRIFRGQDGDMGLAKALEESYSQKGFNAAWSRGLMIQDVATTFTEKYIHLIYGRVDPGEGVIGSVFKGNYESKTLHYGERMTKYWADSSTEQDSPGAHPAMDCAGFVNFVYHSAGLLRNGEALNRYGFSQGNVYEDNHRLAGLENSRLIQVYGGSDTGRIAYTIDSLDGKILKGGYWGATDGNGNQISRDFRDHADVFYNINLRGFTTPIPGDIICMDGHVGIYGESYSAAAKVVDRLMIHSSTGTESGPRINKFGDSYMNSKLITDLVQSWYDKFHSNYARWNNGTTK